MPIPDHVQKTIVYVFSSLVWLTLSILLVKRCELEKEIERNGIVTKARVTDRRYIKSSWSYKMEFRYEGQVYESKGDSPIRYSIGDSISIRFAKDRPEEGVFMAEKYTLREKQ